MNRPRVLVTDLSVAPLFLSRTLPEEICSSCVLDVASLWFAALAVLNFKGQSIPWGGQSIVPRGWLFVLG